MRLNFDSWFRRRILHVPNWIEIKLNNLCLLEWEFKTRHSRSAILFGKTMRRLNQISRTYSFESTKISIWSGACKMRRFKPGLKLLSMKVFHLVYDLLLFFRTMEARLVVYMVPLRLRHVDQSQLMARVVNVWRWVFNIDSCTPRHVCACVCITGGGRERG